MMHGYEPSVAAWIVVRDPENPDDPRGAELDISNERRMLVSAVRAGDLTAGSGFEGGDDRVEITVKSLIPWLRERGFTDLAGGLEDNSPVAAASIVAIKPVQRRAAQKQAILDEIRRQGYDPLALPKSRGRRGVKASVRTQLAAVSELKGERFKHAWDDLRASGEIADAP